jgi:protein XagA
MRQGRRDWKKAARSGICAALPGLFTLLPVPANAGAWTRDEGRGEIIFSSASSIASRRFGSNGRPVAAGSFRKTDAGVSISYGWTADTTLLASLAGTLRQTDAGFEGVAGGTFGIRQALWRGGRTVVSAEVIAGISGERRLLTGAPWDPPFYGEAALQAGQSLEFGGYGAFADLRMAFRLSGAGRRHQARADLTFGIRPTKGWLVLAQGFAVAETGGSGFPSRRWLTAQVSLVYEGFAPWSLQLGLNTRLAGREVAKDAGAVISLWRTF